MEKIVLVTGDRHNPAAHHMKITGTARVGRSFSCDVILSDAHIEPEQLIFHLIDGVRTVEVLPGINPVFRNGSVELPGTYPFISGDEWLFGKTQLTAFNEQHTVSQTEKVFLKALPGGRLTQCGLFLLGISLLVGWLELQGWLEQYQPTELAKDFATNLMTNGYFWFVIFWSIVMGMISRFTSGRSQFNIHLITAVVFVIASSCFETLITYAAYAFNMPAVWNAVENIGFALLLAGFLTVYFSHTLNIRGMRHIVLGLSIAWVGLSYLSEMIDREPLAPVFNASVKPPFAVLTTPDSVENFIQELKPIFAETQE